MVSPDIGTREIYENEMISEYFNELDHFRSELEAQNNIIISWVWCGGYR